MVDRLRRIGDGIYSIFSPDYIKEAKRRKDPQNQERFQKKKKKNSKKDDSEERLLDTRV